MYDLKMIRQLNAEATRRAERERQPVSLNNPPSNKTPIKNPFKGY